MGGTWRHRGRAGQHKRAREALYPTIEWGVTKCYRCTHPLEPGDLVELDHAPDGSYGGFSHGRSPCRVCGRRCNSSAGGQQAALAAGKRLRERPCVICGLVFTASRGTDGAQAATCGRTPCVTALKRLRRAHQPDPEPPPPSGRAW
jgi:hypothetical protein